MAINLTTMTEIDPSSLLTVTSTRVTWTDLLNSSEASLSKSYGKLGDDIEIKLDVRVTAIDKVQAAGDWYLNRLIVIGNAAPVEGTDWWTTITKYFHISIVERGTWTTKYSFYLADSEESGAEGTYAYSVEDCNVGTTYYLTLIRSNSTVTVNIYNDSARTDLRETMEVTIDDVVDIDHTHLLICAGPDSSKDSQIDGYAENLIVTIPATEDPKVTVTSLLNTNINAGTYDITKDDGSTNTTFLAEFDLSEETVGELLGSYDVVVSISAGEATKDQIGLQTWEERVPIDLDVYVVDKYTTGTRVITGTKVRWKAKDELIKLLKASTITAGGDVQVLEILEDGDSDITYERPYLYHSTIKIEAVFVRHG